jgi:hypothetical protein
MNSEQRIAELEAENERLRIVNSALLERLEQRKHPKKMADISKEMLENYWWNLSDEWKKALQHAFLRNGETVFLPAEKDLRALFSAEKLEIVGNGILLFGLEQLSFKLMDLSGLEHFIHLKELNLAGNNLKNLNGISHLKKLELLNLTANKITTLRGIRHLKNLKYLFLRDNHLKNLSEIQHLKQLEIFDCMNNNRLDSIGKLAESDSLRELYIFDFKNNIETEIKTLTTKLKDLKVSRV